MDTRLQRFLSAENITQSELADKLNVARASISHILSGRNKPSFDFLERIASCYPELNLSWLITGEGKMYRNAPSNASDSLSKNTDLPKQSAEDSVAPLLFEQELSSFKPSDEKRELPISKETSTPPKRQVETNLKAKQIQQEGKRISKILIIFDDNTVQEIGPSI